MRILRTISRWLDVPSADPDDARRRKLLNILLVGLAVSMLFALTGNITSDVLNIDTQEQIDITYLLLSVALVLFSGVFAINRYGKGWLASLIFLITIIVIMTFMEEPQEIASGRSTLMFVIPIMMASVLLRPWASFAAAGVCSLVISAAALTLPPPENIPNPYFMGAFLVAALISWLAARSLERALQDLRALNIELDQRVDQRTGELRAILASIADGVVVFDNDDRATLANPAAAGLLARPPDAIVGQDVTSLTGDEVDAQGRETIASLVKGKGAKEPRAKFEWGTRTIAATAAPVQLDSGEQIGTVAVLHDFTGEAERERMRNVFLSIASHDLRSPLSAIMGYSEMVLEGVYTSPEAQRDATTRIHANAQYMLSLANSLLGRAQLEAGALTLHAAPFSPADLVDEVISAMAVLARDKGIALAGQVADDVPPTVSGDRERLSQVLFNLVTNAIKFTDAGSVRVRACAPDGDHWALEVSDTGSGILEEAQADIFEPFYQAGDAAQNEGGVGLGLYIVKQLVDMMGGEIALESQIGRGSTFTVTLPR